MPNLCLLVSAVVGLLSPEPPPRLRTCDALPFMWEEIGLALVHASALERSYSILIFKPFWKFSSSAVNELRFKSPSAHAVYICFASGYFPWLYNLSAFIASCLTSLIFWFTFYILAVSSSYWLILLLLTWLWVPELAPLLLKKSQYCIEISLPILSK